MIDGHTHVYGIIGHPIAHTLSPELHNPVFNEQKRKAVYVAFHVMPELLYEALEALRSLSIRGVNVTLPYKEKILQFIDEVPNDVDRAIGAVNVVRIREKRLLGYNTDGPAFLADLKVKFDLDPKGTQALVVGAGGAARACAFYLVHRGCRKLYLNNRTTSRVEGLAGYLKSFFPKADIQVVNSPDEVKKEPLDLLVNATSCGMKPEDPFPINPDFLSKSKFVYDVIYSPAETKLLKEARKRGARAENGIGMLIYQAVLSHQIWFEDADPKSIQAIMTRAYAEIQKRHKLV